MKPHRTLNSGDKVMGFPGEDSQRLLSPPESTDAGDEEIADAAFPTSFAAAPEDRFRAAYFVYFFLGLGFLHPWNVFITAVDYFGYLYPAVPVDRTFAVAYLLPCLLVLLLVIWRGRIWAGGIRTNAGLGMFTAALVAMPMLDALFVGGKTGVYGGFCATVGAVVLCGVADALVQGSVVGSAGELPEIYMQAVVSGTSASGVLVSAMRIICKAIYPQDSTGLRKSANLYFAVAIAIMIICIICYNAAERLPIVQYYKNLKLEAIKADRLEKNSFTASPSTSNFLYIFGKVKWFGFGTLLIYIVTLSIFPGYITEDVHSEALKDWYPIILISGFNVFDLVGKALPAVYLLENVSVVIGSCVARLLFYPLFLGCIHGPAFFRTEIPVVILTCLLGLSNGYFTSVIMILAPKSVPIQHAESTGIVMVLFLVFGLATGSVVSWFWVI